LQDGKDKNKKEKEKEEKRSQRDAEEMRKGARNQT